MALHVAAGWDWHGRAVKQGAVVYVALERRKLVERRAIAFRNKNPDLTDLPFAICGGIQDLRTPQAVQEIIDTVAAVAAERGEPVVLVVIDTLSRALAGGDENSPKDMGAIVDATSRCRSRPRRMFCGCTTFRTKAIGCGATARCSAQWTQR